MQEICHVHDFMSRSKIQFISIFTFIVNIQYIEISYNLGNKTALYLICNRINHFVGVKLKSNANVDRQ